MPKKLDEQRTLVSKCVRPRKHEHPSCAAERKLHSQQATAWITSRKNRTFAGQPNPDNPLDKPPMCFFCPCAMPVLIRSKQLKHLVLLGHASPATSLHIQSSRHCLLRVWLVRHWLNFSLGHRRFAHAAIHPDFHSHPIQVFRKRDSTHPECLAFLPPS